MCMSLTPNKVEITPVNAPINAPMSDPPSPQKVNKWLLINNGKV